MSVTGFSSQYWTRTTADLSARREPITPPSFSQDLGEATPLILDPSRRYQFWEGGGAAITDSSASLLMHSMTAEQRHNLLTELFSPNQAGFSAVRIALGSCDFIDQNFYSYDDLPDGKTTDPYLEYFSIGEGEPGAPNATKDLKNVIPVLQEILSINPAVKVLASPWSAPAWMKEDHSIPGGSPLLFGRHVGSGFGPESTVEYVYAQYFVKFVQAYAHYGIPIYAVTIQNEPSFWSQWPGGVWTPEQIATFAADYLRPALNDACPQVEIYFADDSLGFFDRPISSYMTTKQAMAFNGVGLHTYSGLRDTRALSNATNQFPNWKLALTERRCMLDETPDEASHIMFGEIATCLSHKGLGLITLWNLALDEKGLPSFAKTLGRRGVVTIDSKTGKVRRNLEYFMLRNFGQDITVGSQRIWSTSNTPDGRHSGLSSVAYLSPDGSDLAGFIYNPTGKDADAALGIAGHGSCWQITTVPAWGVVTFHFSQSEDSINRSEAPADDAFPVILADGKEI